jgi:adenylate cyclase
MCGGRGRCSTCRIRVSAGLDALPPPNPAEANTLAAIGAAGDIRLACQVRPLADVDVVPLLTLGRSKKGPFAASLSAATEHEIAALFVDLRNSMKPAYPVNPYTHYMSGASSRRNKARHKSAPLHRQRCRATSGRR